MSFSDTRLRVFHTVAKHMSFTRAAEEMKLTQPAITFQIRQIEEHFDTRLFDRHHNRVALTEAGTTVFQYADRIITLYQETEKAVHEMTGATRGLVKLGATTTPGEYLLPAVLSGFNQRFPDVQIHLTIYNTPQVIQKLEDAAIDLGMVEGPVKNKQLILAPCIADELVVVLVPNHSLAEMEEIPIQQLKKHPFISREEGSGTRTIIAKALGEAGLPFEKLNIVLEMSSTEAVKTAVENGAGFSVLSQVSLGKELQLGSLVIRRIKDIPMHRTINFVYQKQKFRTKAVETFLDYARGRCAGIKVGE